MAEELFPSLCSGRHGHDRMPGRYAHVCCFCADRQGLGVRGYPLPLEYAWYDPPLGEDPWFVAPREEPDAT